MTKKTKKIGLALGSGAYRGFAHIGVIRTLEKHNLPISYLSGSSIGAWVAAYYSLFLDTTKLEHDLTQNSRENLSLLLDLGLENGLISGKKFQSYLEHKLEGKNFSDTKIPLRLVATDLLSARPYVFSRGSLSAAVRASTSVPIIFKPLEYDSYLLADGGMSNPIPSNLVKDMGADIVIGVNLYHDNEFKEKKLNLSKLVVRSSLVMLHNLAKSSLASANVIISPDLSNISPKNSLSKYFTPKIAQEMILIGEQATEKVIPSIKALL